jgi:secondary thiamine-phosphate synthase enzyme
MQTLKIKTEQQRELIDITDRIGELIPDDFNGVVNVFAKHTTAALTLADLDPGTDQDILDAMQTIMPELDFRHPHNPSHTPDHIWSAIIGPSTQVPVSNGNLSLGTWQRIVLIELNGPRQRNLTVSFLKS